MAGAKVKIGADASEFHREMARVRGSIGGLGRSIVGMAASVASIYTITKAVSALGSVLKDSSMEAAGIESLTMQFETLLGSADAAKKRMEEIAKFAASTPFEIKELSQTSKLLQTLGGNLLATGEGLRMVGDAAAISGQPLNEVGLHIGRIFNAITTGTSAGESVNRLQELGLISGTVKRKFEDLAASQKKGTTQVLSANDALRVMQDVLANTSGAMERLAMTFEGKLSNLNDNFSQLKVAFGTGMNEGIKVALDAVNAGIPLFQAPLTEMGKMFGQSIADAVLGDYDKLIAIGDIIGTAVGVGIKTAFEKTGSDLIQWWAGWIKDVNEFIPTPGSQIMAGGAAKIQNMGGLSGAELFEANLINSGLQGKVAALREMTGTNPNFAPAGSAAERRADSTEVFMRSMERHLAEINRKTQAPKPFPN